MFRVHTNTAHDRGFTLVELAVVLVIMGMLLSVGMSMVGPLTKRAKVIESKEIVNAAAEGIIGFAASNNTLPTLLPAASPQVYTVMRTPNDAWGRQLQYIFSSNLETTPLCGRRGTNLTVNQCTNAACTAFTAIPNIAFILLSSGENYNIQTAGNARAAVARTVNTYLVPPNTAVDNFATDMNRPEGYDDIVKWVTLDELKMKMGCNASLRIINSDIPAARQGAVYPATGSTTRLTADSGVVFTTNPNQGRYSWCVEATTAPVAVPGLTINRIRTAATVALPPVLAGTCLAAAENTNFWGRADELQLSGTPTTPGSFPFTVFVRDNNDIRVNAPAGINNNDNVVQKSFSLTVNPSTTTFRIVTDTIPSGTQGAPYPNAIITADGATTFYNPPSNNLRWCIENTGGTAPAGLTFTPNFIRTTGNCLAQLNLNNGGTSPQVTLAVNPVLIAPGGYPFTIFVRDNTAQPNVTKKSFSFTFNPNTQGYRVWVSGGGNRDFRVGGDCFGTINVNQEITAKGYLKVGGAIGRINTPIDGICSGAVTNTISYTRAKVADTDGDGCLNWNGTAANFTNRTCP